MLPKRAEPNSQRRFHAGVSSNDIAPQNLPPRSVRWCRIIWWMLSIPMKSFFRLRDLSSLPTRPSHRPAEEIFRSSPSVERRLYFKALFEGLFEGPGRDEKYASASRMCRLRVNQKLSTVDLQPPGVFHPNDSRRLIRALEIFELRDNPIPRFRRSGAIPLSASRAVDRTFLPKETLNRRINARVKSMMADGWVEETRQLIARFGSFSLTLRGGRIWELTIILPANCRWMKRSSGSNGDPPLARRQMKWLRRFANVHWLPGDRPWKKHRRGNQAWTQT